MSLNPIFTDDEVKELYAHENWDLCSPYILSFVDRLTQAYQAKLVEQEPSAYAVFSDDGNIRIWTASKDEARRIEARLDQDVTPLYAHPHPEMQKPFTPRNAAEMRDFVGMHFGSLRYANPETEEPSDDDWYTLSIHDLLSAFSWAGHYDHEGLSTTYSAATTPEGWQLVPKEPTEEMHRAARDWSIEKYGKAIGFEASHGCYKYMLAAAPKYMGDSNE